MSRAEGAPVEPRRTDGTGRVKAGQFAYERAHTVEEALALLTEHGDEAKVLAGGQSLIPMMNYRLARPEVLIDIGPVAGLDYVTRDEDQLRLGSLTRHNRVERLTGATIADGYEILRSMVSEIGHAPIRTLGTVGGSLAHADSTAEWCSAALVLGAQIQVRGPRGTRSVPADQFFLGFLTTVLEPDELITEILFPRPCRNAGFAEFAQRKGDFALASVAVALEVDDDSVCTSARLVVGGVADRAVRVPEAEAALIGNVCDQAAIREAAELAATSVEAVDNSAEMAPYRRHLSRTLATRALTEAMAS